MDLDIPRCERWIDGSRAGDEAAFRALIEHAYPFALRSVRRNRSMGSLAKSDDHVNNVMLALVDKLSSSGGRATLGYASWLEENGGKTFADWLRIVISFTVRDYVRTVLGRSAQRSPDLPSVKRLLNEITASPASDEVFGAVRPPLTMAQTARQLLEFASAELPSDQLRALSMWLDDIDFGDIEEALSLPDEDAARKLVRAGIATIRRRFATTG